MPRPGYRTRLKLSVDSWIFDMAVKSELGEFDRLVGSVVDNANCSGCGICSLIDPGLSMELDDYGFNRPVRREPLSVISDSEASRQLGESCPGLKVRRPVHKEQTATDSAMGGAVSSWQAWAIDPETRFRGSSGGVLTALAKWAVESGQAVRVLGAGANTGNPRVTVPLTLERNSDFLGQSGSRYAPVSIAGETSAVDPSSVVVGKPCEASALRQLMDARRQELRPLLLSFFCAGVPSQFATERLLNELGIPEGSPLQTLRYRGHGWPGDFRAEATSGQIASTGYDESWGKHLGPSMQWRCKVCPDGVGESADVVAGDFWKSDAKGYPVFTDSDGVSALIARTRRGHDLIMAAIGEGVIGASPLELRHISSVQPYQVERRATLFARLIGRRLAGWDTPAYRGFGLFRKAFRKPLQSLRYAYGSFRRSRKPARPEHE